jgi:hydrogenase-4 membrane subunit HyfE
MEFGIKLLGVFSGVFARMLLPYFRKLKQNKIDKFDKKYLRIAIGSFILSLIVTLLIFPQFSTQEKILNFESGFKLFCIAFGFGFGFNSLISELSEWKSK